MAATGLRIGIPAVVGHAFFSAASVSTVGEFTEPDAPLKPPHMSLAGVLSITLDSFSDRRVTFDQN
ncbi:hypothetical protein [Streptomyces atratus]|uniref:hypothetical protein n=1 Tax=Streptomyces atratus TaxID=1893 RepID=UPI00340EDE78